VRVHRIPYSTNVERVALAAAHKGIPVEWVDHDPADRSAVTALSGQELVPVAELDDGRVVVDSMAIVAELERRVPFPRLWPTDPARRAELDVFIEWFNGVWKVPPNAIDAALRTPEPDRSRVEAWAAQMQAWLDVFAALLAQRPFLFGDELGAADVCAFPFLKYALLHDPADDDPFHRILASSQRLADRHAELAEWIRRLDALPRA